jgi:hypothetical protein
MVDSAIRTTSFIRFCQHSRQGLILRITIAHCIGGCASKLGLGVFKVFTYRRNCFLRSLWARELTEPFSAFPSWFLQIRCDRCGKDRMLSETYTPQRDTMIRDIVKLMRHASCGGRPSKVELISGIEGAGSQPVGKIVVIDG